MRRKSISLCLMMLASVAAAKADYLIRVPVENVKLAPVAQGNLQVSTSDLDLGQVEIGQSATSSFTITNTGSASGVLSLTAPTAPFSSSHACPASLTASASCTVTVSFTPSGVQSYSGSVSVSGLSVALLGTGIAPAAPVFEVSTADLNFGQVSLTASDTKSVTLTNSGHTAGGVSIGQVSAPFTMTHDCPDSLPPSQSCSLSFTFTPTSAQSYAASVQVSGQQIALTGDGKTVMVSEIVMGLGANHTFAHTTDGSWWATGRNAEGQLGLGNQTNQTSFVKVPALDGATKVVVGGNSTFARKSNGTWWACGLNSSGELGQNDVAIRTLFVPVTALTGATDLVMGEGFVFARMPDGSWLASGLNSSGQLGLGAQAQFTVFTKVNALTGAAKVVVGSLHSIASISGNWYATGYNGQHQLGLTSASGYTAFTQVSAFNGMTDVVTGGYHTVGRKSDGTWWGIGLGAQGQLGTGTVNDVPSLMKIDALTGATKVVASGRDTFALVAGAWYATGYNSNGELGLNDTAQRNSFTPLAAVTAGAALQPGSAHAFLLKADGSLYSSGFNSAGQLGLGDTTQRKVFTKVSDF